MVMEGSHICVAVSAVLVSEVISCWISTILILDQRRQYLHDEQHYLFLEKYVNVH
jgi:hypothetical protein